MVTCIRFVLEINLLFFSDYKIAPPWFEARVTMLFKRMAAIEKTSDKNMKILKLLTGTS